MIKAGIIGGAGYTAGELIRLLLNRRLKSYLSTAAAMPETESPTYTKACTEKQT